MYKYILIKLVVFILFFGVARAESLYLDAQSLGRGGSSIVASGGWNSVFYSPATLHKFKEKDVELTLLTPFFSTSLKIFDYASDLASGSEKKMFDSLKKLKKIPLSANVVNISGILSSRYSVGFLASLTGNIRVFKDKRYSGLETVDAKIYQNYGIVSSYCHSLAEGLHAGVNLKTIFRKQITIDVNLSDIEVIKDLMSNIGRYRNYGLALGIDLGLHYKLKNLVMEPEFAIALSDIGDSRFHAAKNSPKIDPLYQSLSFGVMINPEISSQVINVSLDVKDILARAEKNFVKRLHIGIQYVYDGRWSVASGINQGYPSVGLAFDGSWFRSDIGFYTLENGKQPGDKPDIKIFFSTKFSI
jgi:hypothetical protein